MTSIHPIQRTIVDRLQAVLHTDVRPFGKFRQQIDDFSRHTIRTRADRQTDDLGMRQGRFVERAKPRDRCVRIRGRLKIGEETVARIPQLQPANPFVQLPYDLLVEAADDWG